MENVKDVFAKNLIELRKSHNLTQSELANKLNYSDKAISKWERGESVPDIEIIYQLSKFYGVTIDAMVGEQDILKKKGISKTAERVIISLLSVLLVWIVAVIVFVFFTWFFKSQSDTIWLAFIYAIPASCIVGIVFNSIWGEKFINPIIVSFLLWTLVLSIFLTFEFEKNNYIFIIAIPLQIACVLWFIMRITKWNYKNIFKKKDKNILNNNKTENID